jgi:hypothetical protein
MMAWRLPTSEYRASLLLPPLPLLLVRRRSGATAKKVGATHACSGHSVCKGHWQDADAGLVHGLAGGLPAALIDEDGRFLKLLQVNLAKPQRSLPCPAICIRWCETVMFHASWHIASAGW